MTTLVIEDDDGFITEWPWPDGSLALANTEFVSLFERAHDEARAEAGLPVEQGAEL